MTTGRLEGTASAGGSGRGENGVKEQSTRGNGRIPGGVTGHSHKDVKMREGERVQRSPPFREEIAPKGRDRSGGVPRGVGAMRYHRIGEFETRT